MLRVIWVSGIIDVMEKTLENRETIASESTDSTVDTNNANENQPQLWIPEGSSENPGKPAATASTESGSQTLQPREIGGRDGPEPTRFGDWEKNGRCIDF